MVVGLLGNKSPDSNRFTLVTPKPENGVRLQATLGNQNPTGLPVGAVRTPHNTGITGLNGFMGMFMDMANTTEAQKSASADNPVVSYGSEWTCPLCGSKNKGNFCCECGGARPAKDV